MAMLNLDERVSNWLSRINSWGSISNFGHPCSVIHLPIHIIYCFKYQFVSAIPLSALGSNSSCSNFPGPWGPWGPSLEWVFPIDSVSTSIMRRVIDIHLQWIGVLEWQIIDVSNKNNLRNCYLPPCRRMKLVRSRLPGKGEGRVGRSFLNY